MCALTTLPEPRRPLAPEAPPPAASADPPRGGAARRSGRRAALLALLLYGAIALALFPRLVMHLAGAFPGDLGDPPSQAWVMTWDLHALTTHGLSLSALYDGAIFYPFHDALAYQDTLLGILPLAAPILLLTGNPVLTYNALFLASFVLCAWGAYLLALLLTKDARAAFLAGLIYGFSPYRMVHLYHLNLLCGMWIPLALVCWERVRRGDARYWAGVGLFVALQALSALYYAAFLAVALGLLFLIHLRRAPCASVRPLLRGAAATATCCALALAPFVAPYIRVERQLGGSRGLGQVVYFAADLRDFLHSVDLSVLYGWSGHTLGVGSTDALQYLWPGVTALALALWGMKGRRAKDEGRWAISPSRRKAWAMGQQYVPTDDHRLSPIALRPTAYALLLVAAAVLCLGPFLKVWGVRTMLPLPYLLLYPLPGFTGLRDPARFGAIYTLALAVLAAYGAAALLRVREPATDVAWQTTDTTVSPGSPVSAYPLLMKPKRCSRPRRQSPWSAMRGQAQANGVRARGLLVTALLAVAILAESWIAPLPAVPVPVGAAVPPVYHWLAARPVAPVLELPIGLDNKTVWAEQAQMMLYATYHWRPIVNGTGGFAPPGYAHDAAVYMSFPSPAALGLLRARGVRYVIVHRAWLGARATDTIRARVAHEPGVRLAGRWPDADAYVVDGRQLTANS